MINKEKLNNMIGYSIIFLFWFIAILFNYIDYQNANKTNIRYCTSGSSDDIILCINKHNDMDRELFFRRTIEEL